MKPPAGAPPIAVIDVGSNSIKAMVASCPENKLQILLEQTIESRISRGMYGDPPCLVASAMIDAIAAIQTLLGAIAPHDPSSVSLLATSALRDASNRETFSRMVANATGLQLQILTGPEEAQYIAAGIREEPLLDHNKPFLLADLGGGSLEVIASRGHDDCHLCSLNLGAVRLLERFHPNPADPIPESLRNQIKEFCRQEFENNLSIFGSGQFWGTGGAFTIIRKILAMEVGHSLSESTPEIPVVAIQSLESLLSDLPLAERQTCKGLPAARADIFPIALSILLSLAQHYKINCFRHSFYNLRVGFAVEKLQSGKVVE